MDTFIATTVVIILAVLSPGPDFAMVSKNSILHSRQSGIFTALGVAVGSLIHGTYCVLGLALVISKSLLLFSIIKYIGAAYLVYIGIRGLFSKTELKQNQQTIKLPAISNAKAFAQGFLCNVLNPKTIMFYLAIFTMVIHPDTKLIWEYFFAVEISSIHLIWFLTLAFLLTTSGVKNSMDKIQNILSKFLSGFLILLGIKLATLTQAK